MGTAKRLFLYTVAAVSLLVLSVGLYNLLAVVFGELADALGASIIGGGGSTGREQVSLAIALVVVGAPAFAIDWWLVGRGWRGMDDAGRADRDSAIRAFHLGLVATVALAVGTVAAVQSLDTVVGAILGVEHFSARPTDQLAILFVAAPIWWYHQRRRNLDIRHDQLTGAAAWLTRFHRYAWTFVGLMLLVVGASQVLETIASVLIGRPGFGGRDAGWLDPLAFSLSTLLVGAGIFVVHAADARRAIRDAAIIGEDDRTTALRATYFGVVILVTLAYVGVTVTSSLAELARWGSYPPGDANGLPAFLELVIGPLLVAIPFAVAGWLHWAALRREAGNRSPVSLAAAVRLALHLAAGVGLAFLAVGAGQLLGRVLEVALGGAVAGDFFRTEATWDLALVVVGAVMWIPAWTRILRRREADPLAERQATAGRAYLYLVIAASLFAAVPSAAFSLYRLIDTALGGGGVALGTDLAIPIAVVIVASVVAVYHGRTLVSDLHFSAALQPAAEAATVGATGAAEVSALTPGTVGPADAVEPAEAEVGAAEAEVGASLVLTLRGPLGTDLSSLADTLRDRLPAGVTLEDG